MNLLKTGDSVSSLKIANACTLGFGICHDIQRLNNLEAETVMFTVKIVACHCKHFTLSSVSLCIWRLLVLLQNEPSKTSNPLPRLRMDLF